MSSADEFDYLVRSDNSRQLPRLILIPILRFLIGSHPERQRGKIYALLYQVSTGFSQLLLFLAPILPKIKLNPIFTIIRFYDTEYAFCTSRDDENLIIRPYTSLYCLPHFNICSLTAVFPPNTIVDDAALADLQYWKILAFRKIIFDRCDMRETTEDGLKSFLSDVANQQICTTLVIKHVQGTTAVTDNALLPLVKCNSLELLHLTITKPEAFSAITNQSKLNFADKLRNDSHMTNEIGATLKLKLKKR